ncbi:MAG: hypothetical protein ACI4OZ_00855 [Akkermansia sp.]
MEYRLFAQEYGKDDSFGGTYRILKQHDEMLRFETQIRDVFSFQWMPGPGVYRPVWYFLRLDSSLGLLAVFSDKGGDPRPHVLGRIVALCHKHEHTSLLLAVQNSAVNSFSCDDSGVLTIDCVPGQGEFEWSTRILQVGDRGSYAGLGESPEPGPRKPDPKPNPLPGPTPLPRTTPPFRNHAPCSLWVLCILLVLCLSSIIAAIFFYNRSQQRSSELEGAQAEIDSLRNRNTLLERSKQDIEISKCKEEKGKTEERCEELELKVKEERKKLQDALVNAYNGLDNIQRKASPNPFSGDHLRMGSNVEKALSDIMADMKVVIPPALLNR